ncbi:hypothetical protein LTR84_010830 [Exophiala bonariae]|uniref:EDC4-like protein pdc1 beta-propeller domain-containing protein n=1 Tax=Exophiala bonariae TaxID=1690606 RepID=A0AAV9NHX4_9EURO|nr:hypothetical protein LTR84_010830 [Exophiala bonariae]
MSTNDLQALFANLKPKPRDPQPPSTIQRSTSSGHQPQNANAFALNSASPPPFSSLSNDPLFSSLPSGSASASAATAQSLLSLLNFGASSSSTGPSVPPPGLNDTRGNGEEMKAESGPPGPESNAPQVSTSDLLAKFISPVQPTARPATHSPANLEDQGGGGPQSSYQPLRDASQDALLKLLNRATATSTTVPRQGSVERAQPASASEDKGEQKAASAVGSSDLPFRVLPSRNSGISTPSEDPRNDNKTAASAQTQPLFTYTNPFQALQASRSQTPKTNAQNSRTAHADSPVPSVEPTHEDKFEGEPVRMATPEQVAKRKILTPRLSATARPGAGSPEASPAVPVPAQDRSQATPEATPIKSKLSAPEITAATNTQGDSSDANASSRSATGAVSNAVEPQAEVGDEWEDAEDAEDSPEKEEPSERIVPVYNFPIKPFVSITLQLDAKSDTGIRDDGVMEISRLKRDFDQLDRSLASATSKYISYALVKSGMRIIRQDDGKDRQVFKHANDRVFNVSFCSALDSDDQAILGTGVSGAVYYATLAKDSNDLFDNNELDSESLIFPPYPPADENTAGGVLKTRAKRSSRHPEFFAIGRGKAIHLVWPATALSSRYGITQDNRRVNVGTFFQDRSLQISTGKAGKDFTFSEDDSLIVSLDKTGRLRFWDIRKLIDESNATGVRANMTVDMPLLSLSTASPAEKSWPTSVLFVDKARPYTRGGPLRYVLVGLRQNHTLQLWDIALGKAVQELNFPHENETDGICSVAYHPNSSIIVIGHPTRNSIFFVHLSAPRYTLSASLSQAAFINRIAMKDPELPKPESTACMSGIREISFASKGQLRSVELLPINRPLEAQKALDEKTPLFELYAVHSNGVTCLNITKEDLGWDSNSKVMHGIDANKNGFVNLKELRLGSVIEEAPRSKSPTEDVPPAAPKPPSKKKSSKKGLVSAEREVAQPEQPEPVAAAPIQPLTNGSVAVEPTNGETPAAPKESKKNKKKAAAAATHDQNAAGKTTPRNASPIKNPQPIVDAPVSKDAGLAEKPDLNPPPNAATTTDSDTASKAEAVTVGISGDWLDKELKKVERGVSNEFRKELSTLYQSIQNDRLVQDAAASTRQEALLRLVSTTLTTNVEKSLSRILATQVQQAVIPALTGITVQAVHNQLGDALAKSLHSLVPHELNVQLPIAINNALQSPQVTRLIADTISQKITKHTEAQISEVLQRKLVPVFSDLALSAAQKAAAEVEAKRQVEIQQYETQRRQDTARMEKLSQALQSMAQTLQQMSDTQVAFQTQILKDRRQLALLEADSPASATQQVSTARLTPSQSHSTVPTPQKPKSQEQLELDEIAQLMDAGRYEEGSIRWLQSSQPIELFDQLFIHYTPEYLATDVSPLIAFSIAVTLGNSLNSNTARRLEWIAAAFNAVDLLDPEIADLAQHAPQLLSSLIQKIEGLYMTIAERDPRDPALRIMPAVSRRAKDMMASLVGPSSYGRPAQPLIF